MTSTPKIRGRGRPLSGKLPLDVAMPLRMDADTRDSLAELAELDGVSIGELIRTACREYLAGRA